jgi:cation transport ATPase
MFICIKPSKHPSINQEVSVMKKTYKIDVDCAACAEKMQEAAKKTEGVKDAVVSFMTLKMKVEFDEGADPAVVMPKVRENCKKVEEDCEVFL